MDSKIGAIILAAGRGSRLNSTTVNKVALPFHGKPMIEYAVDIVTGAADPIVVVVGAFADSVKDALKTHPNILYAEQTEQLGTGHAALVGFEAIKDRGLEAAFIGYGDHMMFYRPETIKRLLDIHSSTHADLSFLTTECTDPEELAWGHILRDKDGKVAGIVEHKDATAEQKLVKEVNPGFYLCGMEFLRKHLSTLTKSETTGEIYLTELIERAVKDGAVVNGVLVPFVEVGIGINRADELAESQKLHSAVNGS